MQPACNEALYSLPSCQHMQAHGQEAERPAQAATQLVDDMAALLVGSALQLLGGACRSGAAAVDSLQVLHTSASSVKAERTFIWTV